MEPIIMSDKVSGELVASSGVMDGFKIGSLWTFECYDKHGNLKWEERDRPNIVTHEGLDFLLNVMFHETAAIATWYVAPVETDTTAVATMTYATPVYTESTAYTEATRQAFNEAAASSQSITNSANKATITMNATKTLYGAALVGGGTAATTKGNADGGGTLFCYSKFATSRAVISGDTFKISITITSAHA